MSVKSPQTLLKLSKNPFYKLTAAQQEILDDFLSQTSVSGSTSSPKKNSRKRSKTSPATAKAKNVIVKNKLEKNTGHIEEDIEGIDE